MNKLLQCSGSIKLLLDEQEIYPIEVQHGMSYSQYIAKELEKNPNQNFKLLETTIFHGVYQN